MDTEQTDSRHELQTLVRRAFVRACEDLNVPCTRIAVALGLGSSTVVERWNKVAPLPLWVLAHPDAIPDALYNRLLAVVSAQRTLRAAGIRPTCEGAAFGVLSDVGVAVAELAQMLADFRLSGDERPKARALAHTLIARLEAMLRAIDDADRAEDAARVTPVRVVR